MEGVPGGVPGHCQSTPPGCLSKVLNPQMLTAGPVTSPHAAGTVSGTLPRIPKGNEIQAFMLHLCGGQQTPEASRSHVAGSHGDGD